MNWYKFAKHDGDLKEQILEFFKDKPDVTDEDIRDFAKKQGYSEEEIKNKIYSVLSDFLSAGRATEKNIDKSDVDKRELNTGINVEKEHTVDKAISGKIALDHLAEIPDYYNRLKDMEEQADKEGKKLACDMSNLKKCNCR